MMGMKNDYAPTLDVDWECIWVYALVPFAGAYCASLFFGFHTQVTKQAPAPPAEDEKSEADSRMATEE
jgi:hypothetical protein